MLSHEIELTDDRQHVYDIHQDQELIRWILSDYSRITSGRLEMGIRDHEDNNTGELWRSGLRRSVIFPIKIGGVISSIAIVNPTTLLGIAGLPLLEERSIPQERIIIVQKGYPESTGDIFQIGVACISPEEEEVMMMFAKGGDNSSYSDTRRNEGSFFIPSYIHRHLNGDHQEEKLRVILSGLSRTLDFNSDRFSVRLVGISNPLNPALHIYDEEQPEEESPVVLLGADIESADPLPKILQKFLENASVEDGALVFSDRVKFDQLAQGLIDKGHSFTSEGNENGVSFLVLRAEDVGQDDAHVYILSLDPEEQDIFQWFDQCTGHFDINAILEVMGTTNKLQDTLDLFRKLDHRLGLAGASQYREQLGLVAAIAEISSRVQVNILFEKVSHLTDKTSGLIKLHVLIKAISEHLPRDASTIRWFVDRTFTQELDLLQREGKVFLITPEGAWDIGMAVLEKFDQGPIEYIAIADIAPHVISHTGCSESWARRKIAKFISSELPGVVAHDKEVKIPLYLVEVIIGRVSEEIIEHSQGIYLTDLARSITRNLGRSGGRITLACEQIRAYADETGIKLEHAIPIERKLANEIERELTKRLRAYSRRQVVTTFTEEYDVSFHTVEKIVGGLVEKDTDHMLMNPYVRGRIGEKGKDFIISELRKLAEIRGWRKLQRAIEAN